jgi:hypothetical protein
MGRFSDLDANDVLDSRFGAGVFGSTNVPAVYFVGLSSTLPDNTGGNVTEPDGVDGYARVAVDNDSTNWPPAAGRAKANGAVIQFPTATGDWVDVAYFVLYDDVTGGALRAWGELNLTQTIVSGAAASFPPGDLTITVAV